MGYIRHHAIVCTTYDEPRIEECHKIATEIFGTLVSPIIESKINGYFSIFIAPDGSKEGWLESNNNEENRARFATWIQEQAFDDLSNPFSCVEVMYGDDEGQIGIRAYSKP